MRPASFILFLDFDGVLHPGNSGSFSHLPRFQEFLRAHPHVDVVLITSWRIGTPLVELKELFDEDLQSRIIGATPEVAYAHTLKRHSEILHWLLMKDRRDSPWAALDSDASLYPERCENLVLCDFQKGIAEPDYEKLVQLTR